MISFSQHETSVQINYWVEARHEWGQISLRILDMLVCLPLSDAPGKYSVSRCQQLLLPGFVSL